MGLGAIVMCNCFQEGKTTPPPFPAEWLEVDEEASVNLKKEYDTNENWDLFNAWDRSCCEHPRMEFVSEHIANWGSFNQFRKALKEIGLNRFPTLKEQLPTINGGFSPSSESEKALLELENLSNYTAIDNVPEFDEIKRALKVVFNASITLGNPVCWC